MKKLTIGLLFATAAIMSAQTTTRYTLQQNFLCDVSQSRPLHTIYQWDCRGITFVDQNTGNTVDLFQFNIANFFWVLNPGSQGINSSTRTYQVNMPGDPPPNTFQVFWTITLSDGTVHTGMFSGNWQVVTTRLGGQRPEILAGATFDETH